MGAYQFRALRRDGSDLAGQISAASESEALAQLRGQGVQPVELRLVGVGKAAQGRLSGKSRGMARAVIGELAILLDSGLTLDRSLALAIGNSEDAGATAVLSAMLKSVREGASLSRAMLDQPQLFSSAEAAMAEAGETNGRLGEALGQLARMLANAEELRRLITTSMIYPAALLTVAVGVILMILLYVVPQFERLIDNNSGQLPAASVAVLAASRFLQDYGLYILFALAGAVLGVRQMVRRPTVRRGVDRFVLRVPMLGELVRRIDTARFAAVLGTLVEAGVPVPNAMALARRTIANSAIGDAVEKVAEGVREGGGIAGPMAAAKVLPPLAIGFLRTGEETSRLGLMLRRLAEVLDLDVRTRLERLIAVLTPLITVVLGTVVASIIAAIMSAILGFNDMAVMQP